MNIEAQTALNLYETACETHKRQDWRLACHALAKSLRAALEGSVSPAAIAAADPAPQPASEPKRPRAVAAKASAPVKTAKAGKPLTMTSGSIGAALRMLPYSPRSIVHILRCIRIDAAPGSVTMTATDLDMIVSIEIEAPEQSATFTAFVEGADLRALLSATPAPQSVALQMDAPGVLTIFAGPTFKTFSQQSTPVEDWPTPFNPMARGSGAGVDFLSEHLAWVCKAQSSEETRYYLNGVYFHTPAPQTSDNGKATARLVATDGHRFHMAKIEAPDGLDLPSDGAIIPRYAVKTALAAMAKAPLDAFACADLSCRFDLGQVTIWSKLVDGCFPDYEMIIPQKCENFRTFDNASMQAALAPFVRSTPDKSLPVKVSIAGENFHLSRRDATGAETCGDVPVLAATLNAPDVGFNSAYLAGALAGFPAGRVELAGSDPASPHKISDGARTAVIMPLRT